MSSCDLLWFFKTFWIYSWEVSTFEKTACHFGFMDFAEKNSKARQLLLALWNPSYSGTVLYFSRKICYCNKVTWENKEILFWLLFFFNYYPNPLEMNALTYVVAKKELQVQTRKFWKNLWKTISKTGWVSKDLLKLTSP